MPSVCMSVCLHSHNVELSLKFSVHIADDRVSVISGGIAISYVLPVWWIASYFDIIGPMHICVFVSGEKMAKKS